MRNWSKPKRLPRRFAPSRLRTILLVLFVVGSPNRMAPQTQESLPFVWNEAVHTLAGRIVATFASSHAFSIDVKDISQSAPVGLGAVSRTLADDLASLGARLTEAASADSQLQITISQGVEGYVMIAQASGPAALPAVLVAVANPEKIATQPGPTPTLVRRIVWQQSHPILDFAQADIDASHTVWYLLEPERIEVYEFSAGAQILHEARTLGRAFASRDPRGRIVVTDATHVTSYLAGMQCDGAWEPAFTIQCQPIPGQQWPMGTVNWRFESPRNNFAGNMIFSGSLEAKFPAFFSAASPPPETSGETGSRWIVAGIDGQAQLFSGSAGAISTFRGWGSDIATLTPACGSQWQVLASGPGDWTQPDRLQLYEITEERAVAVGQPLDVPGPVVSLWPASDGKSARVVVRNLETELYEASLVSVACSD
ncbi:MAG TPA: hypothetical protein VEJ46_13850 [Candidatus Acidoferrum sp.]|nr:hypothetical protein [Candidatus Acidoferrum sp.]